MSTYWKQFVVWATDLRSKYSDDIFFKTELNVIILQIVFTVVISVFLLISFNYLYRNIVKTLIQGINENIQTNGSIGGSDILNSMQIVKSHNFIVFVIITISISLLFSYIIAKITLTPARNALKIQKRFISDIAHELRTPLSILKANNEVALMDERRGNSVGILESNIEELDRASSIINNLLSFNNLIRPEKIQFNYVNVGEVASTAVKKLDELSQSKNIRVIIENTNPSYVYGNSTALEQIAINIIKNAILYTQANGLVKVIVRPDYKGNVMLSVIDNGIGISEKDLNHIFEPFFRAEKSRNTKAGNVGLGLTIVSELVKLHNGKISVKSQLNTGTTVTVKIPYKEEASIEKNIYLGSEISVDYGTSL